MKDGRIELDNNRAERSIKPFVIGRKNWLFAASTRGATTSAIAYSLVETAKENGLNPFFYLQFLFEKLPQRDLEKLESFEDLMPWSKKLPTNCYIVTFNQINSKIPSKITKSILLGIFFYKKQHVHYLTLTIKVIIRE